MYSMSTETAAHKTDVSTACTALKDTAKLVFVVPVATGAAMMVLGTLFLVIASPASGSLTFGAVASTMVGMVVGGFVVTAAFVITSFVTPWFDRVPDPPSV